MKLSEKVSLVCKAHEAEPAWCPFCESADVEVQWAETFDQFWVLCNACKATGPYSLDIDEAVMHWGSVPR
jgi:hypothetical protein